jgi:hypothetical protein
VSYIDFSDADYMAELSDRDEMRRESRYERMREAELSRHPDCRDPDHPGCWKCEDEEE